MKGRQGNRKFRKNTDREPRFVNREEKRANDPESSFISALCLSHFITSDSVLFTGLALFSDPSFTLRDSRGKEGAE